MDRRLAVILCVLGYSVTGVRAEDSAHTGNAGVRAAVSRALPFLEQEGVAWMNDRGCSSCHHVPLLVWSHRAAESRGVPVNLEKLSTWELWAQRDSLAHRNLFRLQSYDLGRVEPAKLPDEVKAKLKPLLELPFKTQDEFLETLSPLLTRDELQSHQAMIIQTAERTPYAVDRTGGGLDVLGQILLGGSGSKSPLTEAEFRQGVIDLMQQIQLPDGSWTPGNQFATMRRWSLSTANQTTTMWAAIALASADGLESKHAAAVEKAVAYLRQQPGDPENREWLATRLLFELRFGSADQVAHWRRLLLDARQSDGGWGWEKGVPSDALTTGLAIYVLSKLGSSDEGSVVQDARQFLLSTQQPDGSWLTPATNITKSTEPERLLARDEIYHYWGTAWAVIGLLETLTRPGE